jgi:hypothetical protein
MMLFDEVQMVKTEDQCKIIAGEVSWFLRFFSNAKFENNSSNINK